MEKSKTILNLPRLSINNSALIKVSDLHFAISNHIGTNVKI